MYVCHVGMDVPGRSARIVRWSYMKGSSVVMKAPGGKLHGLHQRRPRPMGVGKRRKGGFATDVDVLM